MSYGRSATPTGEAGGASLDKNKSKFAALMVGVSSVVVNLVPSYSSM